MKHSAVIRLGTRGSLLARTQSGQVAAALRNAHPGLQVDLITISTSGDRFTDAPLADAGGKGLFTKELEIALLENHIDLAVHSFKDVPVTMPLVDQADLIIGSVPERQDPRDVLVSRKATSLRNLPAGSKIGTGSLRRKCQILALRPDLVIVPMRGNVDTRISKLDCGDCDAIVLALAGLLRIEKFDSAWMHPIDTETLLPAAAQGALALQCRRDDAATAAIISVLNDRDTFDAVAAEREVVLALNGDCHSPIAALAVIDGENLSLSAAVGQRDGLPPVKKSSATAPRGQWKTVVEKVCETLK
jgi:hydroxymethylbilane synthase